MPAVRSSVLDMKIMSSLGVRINYQKSQNEGPKSVVESFQFENFKSNSLERHSCH
jgi:hypothetical protein